MTNTKLFFGGIPTDIEVNKLVEHFGKPEPATIAYADIEPIIGLAGREPRFKSVLTKWRRILFRELNIDTEMEAGIGMRVFAPGERIDASHRDMRSAIRKTRKWFLGITSVPTDKLNDIERKKYDHALRSASMGYTALTVGEKQLTDALKVPRQLPRRDASESQATVAG